MSKKPKPRESHRGLIVSSIFVSVAFHAVLLYFLWNNPFGFDSSYSPPLGFRKNHESIESGTQNHDMIREALDDMVITQSDENHLPLITEIVDEPETITILKNHDAEKSSNLLPQKMQFYTNMALLRSLEDEKGPLPIVEKQHLAIEQVKLLARPETPVDFSHLHKTNYHPKAASDSLAEDIQQIANRDNHFDLNIDKNTLPLAVSAVKHEDALIFDVNPQAEISYTATT
ncbi:MAG: hypothetical protein P0S94_00415, partial [Simkaniaceae bacterium]|nr:hypothetical protein [Simkaniaceae bacterium]